MPLGTTVMESLSGRLFGVYRIVEPLGAGGMASVYKAYQSSVDRYVALKILPSHLAMDPDFLVRFEQEAKILANLQHPHILPVHDFGESDGFTYIVMPFIKTGTLSAALQGNPLPFEQIKRVITQVGDALDCAHSQGLVHRDVKPSNVLLDERGNCLLADFGIAKMLERTEPLTATGGVVGTPRYMSPEQGMGQTIDGRSDVYALGVILYEMATGRPPFAAETPLAVVVKHIHDPLPVPSQVNPNIPDGLERMIFRAMHKEPSERFATAGAMVDAMAALPPPQFAMSDKTVGTVVMEGVRPWPGHQPGIPTGVDRPAGLLKVFDAIVRRDPSYRDRADAGVTRTTPVSWWRPIGVGASAVVVVVALLLMTQWFVQREEAGSVLLPSQIDTTSPPVSSVTADQEPLVDLPLDPATVGNEPPLPASGSSPDAVVSPPSAGLPLPTAGELLLSVDTASMVAVDGDEIGRLEPGDTRVVVLPVGEHLVVATADDGITRVQAIADLQGTGRHVVVLELADRADRLEEPRIFDPYPDQGDGTFLDLETGQLWTIESAPTRGPQGFLWPDANIHCQRLRIADAIWRLPTQPELDSVLQRIGPNRYPWGLTLWSADRPFGESNRLWVSSSPLYAPQWSTAVRDASARRLTHQAVCIAEP